MSWEEKMAEVEKPPKHSYTLRERNNWHCQALLQNKNLIEGYVSNNDKEPTVLENHIAHNRMRVRQWQRVAIETAFVRANLRHPFKFSFLPLVPGILQLVG